jgi:hypothetical protein
MATTYRCQYLELWNWGDGKDSWDGAKYFWRADDAVWRELSEEDFNEVLGNYAFGLLMCSREQLRLRVLGELVRQARGVG